MKKYLLIFSSIFFIGLFFVPNTLGVVIVDTTDASATSGRSFGHESSGIHREYGFKYIPISTHNLGSISFILCDNPENNGVDTDALKARVYNISGTLLTTSFNSHQRSEFPDCSPEPMDFFEFNFSPITLTVSEKYFILLGKDDLAIPSPAAFFGIVTGAPAYSNDYPARTRFASPTTNCSTSGGGDSDNTDFCIQNFFFYGIINDGVPENFLSQIQNSPNVLEFRSPNLSSNVTRELPEGWVVKILETTDSNGDYIESNGYRWYKVKDLTDNEIGWMQAIKLSDNTVYLDYDENAQDDLKAKADPELQSTIALRRPKIINAVDAYRNYANTGNSLDQIGGGNGSNDFSSFTSLIPKELILGIISQESGPSFNNNICSGYNSARAKRDGGMGIMQITDYYYKGLGSGLRDDSKATNDCIALTPGTTTYYSNSEQGIYANIKDGFRNLQDKYAKAIEDMAKPDWIAKCDTTPPLNVGGTDISCSDLKKILTTWNYRGFKIFFYGGENMYLGDVSNKLANLNTYFPGSIDSNNEDQVDLVDDLILKLDTANKNKQSIKLHSPGDLSVVDSLNNRTGVFDGTQTEEITFSVYEADEKGIVIFFPDDTYSYLIQGTDTGTYGLTVDFNDNSETPLSVSSANVPMTPDTIHKYTVDWDDVDNSIDGVHIDIDQDGDGTYEYGIDVPNDFEDSVAPTTTSSLSGTSGTNGWYTSNVTVTLSVTDNAGGTGVLETKYSTDNGTTWSIYSSPFTVSSEGANTIKYYSSDKIGNIESTTQIIKIDKTAPESKISFDTNTGLPKIEGIDNLSTTTVTKVDDSNYTITDDSGRTLKINLLAIQTAPTLTNPAVLNIQVNSLQYDANPVITLPITTLIYITVLTQNVTVVPQFVITGAYNPVNDTTEVVTIQGDLPSTQTLPGVRIIKLTTQVGNLGFEY